MSTDPRPVAPWPGSGLVARAGSTALVVAEPVGEETARRLLALIAEAGGGALVRELGKLVLDPPGGEAPDVGVVTEEPGGAMVFLRGRMTFRGEAAGEEIELRGEDVVTWVERSLGAPLSWYEMGAGVAPAAVDPLVALRAGAVRGAGLSVGAAPEPTADDAPAAAVEEQPVSDFHSIRIEADPSLVEELQPLPVDGDAAGEPAPEPDPTLAPPEADAGAPEQVIVKGYRCPRNHHNRPGAQYCVVCGIKMGVHKTLVAVDGVRPPLGVLVFDDGATVPVVHDMVIGREPEVDELVRERRARPVRIDDDSQSVSRAHLHVMLDGWDAYVIDRGSSNGTRVRGAEGGPWQELAPQARALIETGSVVMMGEREVRFAQHHVR